MLHFFRLAIFLGAGLLFLIQPLFARMVLPMLGGSPGVWNTCMLFFQGMLLAGYAYAHLTRRWLGTRVQIVLHLTILATVALLPVISIPLDWQPPVGKTPVFWLLGLLLIVVGAPFVVVSATSPILQSWFASSRHHRSGNPYFLYAASNAGSMLALLAYPFVLERFLPIDQQVLYWKYAYLGFVVLMIVCGVFAIQSKPGSVEPGPEPPQVETGKSNRENRITAHATTINWTLRFWWILLAFVATSWMLGVTTYLTTDISPMPALWVIPLALYLLTFMVAFADQTQIRYEWISRAFPIAMMILAATTIFQGGLIIMMIHLIVFFIGAMACHMELARLKPTADRLTEFYLWISVGGVLGGMFNGLISPLIFSWVLEYPIVLAIACVLRPTFGGDLHETGGSSRSHELTTNTRSKPERGKSKRQKNKRETSKFQNTITAEQQGKEKERQTRLVCFLFFALFVVVLSQTHDFQGTLILTLATFVCLAALCVGYFLDRPLWFGLPLAILLILGELEPPQSGEQVLLTRRGFFGVNRVVKGPLGHQVRLYHGKTVHGIQNNDPQTPELHGEPMSYYHRLGPLGDIFDRGQAVSPFREIGIVGLGAGTAACYHRSGQRLTFFEIDPIVMEIAEDPQFFRFLQDCGSENYEIVLGDGRRMLDEIDRQFDLIVFDAFSSDAIPIHLITREAIQGYLEKLSPRGFLAFHISNNYFDLEPILGDIAEELKLDAVARHDQLTPEEIKTGRANASYVVIAKELSQTGLHDSPVWNSARTRKNRAAWTDDFSNALEALK